MGYVGERRPLPVQWCTGKCTRKEIRCSVRTRSCSDMAWGCSHWAKQGAFVSDRTGMSCGTPRKMKHPVGILRPNNLDYAHVWVWNGIIMTYMVWFTSGCVSGWGNAPKFVAKCCVLNGEILGRPIIFKQFHDILERKLPACLTKRWWTCNSLRLDHWFPEMGKFEPLWSLW